MLTKTSIHGHPVHPMLIVFPIALYLAGLAALIGYTATMDVFWYRAAYLAMLAGGATGVIAAIFGAIDVIGLPRDTRAKAVGYRHGALAFAATVLFVAAGLVMRYDFDRAPVPVALRTGLPLVLSILGAAVLLFAGYLGWELVGSHHVGVSPVPGRAGASELPGALARHPHPQHKHEIVGAER